MSRIDCLLVHVPKAHNYYPPLNYYSSLHWMSQSLLGLADALEKQGVHTRVLHLGIEQHLNAAFSLSAFVEQNDISAVGFSMHFHQQISDVLKQAKAIKTIRPATFIFLGGMTATYFARDILNTSSDVDAVIRGEAEDPIVQLLSECMGEKNLSRVDNLVWRTGNRIIENRFLYTANERMLDSIRYTDLSYLLHHQFYRSFPKAIIRTRLPESFNYKVSQTMASGRMGFFPGLVAGRGCHINCYYCSGGNKGQKMLNKRNHVIFRSVGSVLDDIQLLLDYRFSGSFLSFDPRPQSESYYKVLFQQIRAKKINFNIIFSSWSIPEISFLKQFRETFGGDSSVGISPETGSETLRKRIRGHYYSNEELYHVLDFSEKLELPMTVFFSLGIPFEERADFEQTLRMKEEINSRYKYITVKAFLVEMEPGSPWHLAPEKYGIADVRKNLLDYMSEQCQAKYSTMTSMGYRKKTYLGEQVRNYAEFKKKVLKTRCEHFCNMRILCKTMRGCWLLGNLTGITHQTQ